MISLWCRLWSHIVVISLHSDIIVGRSWYSTWYHTWYWIWYHRIMISIHSDIIVSSLWYHIWYHQWYHTWYELISYVISYDHDITTLWYHAGALNLYNIIVINVLFLSQDYVTMMSTSDSLHNCKQSRFPSRSLPSLQKAWYCNYTLPHTGTVKEKRKRFLDSSCCACCILCCTSRTKPWR